MRCAFGSHVTSVTQEMKTRCPFGAHVTGVTQDTPSESFLKTVALHCATRCRGAVSQCEKPSGRLPPVSSSPAANVARNEGTKPRSTVRSDCRAGAPAAAGWTAAVEYDRPRKLAMMWGRAAEVNFGWRGV